MSQEIFRKLRQMLMEKLDVYRELTDQEILETIDELPLWALSANAAASPIIGFTPSVIAQFIFLMYLSL